MKQIILNTSTMKKAIGAVLDVYFIAWVSLYLYIIVTYWGVTAYLGPLLQFVTNTTLPLLILGIAFRAVKRHEKHNAKIIINFSTKNATSDNR